MAPLWTIGAVALAIVPTIHALTPLELVSTNIWSYAQPNPTGEFALHQGGNYTFDEASGSLIGAAAFYNYINLTSGDISTWYLGTDITQVIFVGPQPTSILYLNGSNAEGNGGVSLYVADVHDLESATLVADLAAPLSGFKAGMTAGGNIRFVAYGQANPDGSAYHADAVITNPYVSSGRVYDSTYVRVYNHWRAEQLNAVFGGELVSSTNGSYTFNGQLTNYVTGICNLTCAESPIDQGAGGASTFDYDISPDGSTVAFNTKNINLPLANYSSSQIYTVPFNGTAADATILNPIDPAGLYPDAQGLCQFVTFSPDSSRLSYLQINSATRPSDKNMIYVADVATSTISRLAGAWDNSPQYIGWFADSETLWAGAPYQGTGPTYAVPIAGGDCYIPTKKLTSTGTLRFAQALPNNQLLITDTKIWSAADVYRVSLNGTGPLQTYFKANEMDPILAADGMGPKDVRELWYASNTTNFLQQAWVVLPRGFDSTKKYPLAMITHGGPEAASFNMWNVIGQWSFKTWADQGYVVVAPNPTGSWGWGQNFTSAVYGHWGDLPYWDLVHCFKAVQDQLAYVDTDNAVHAGPSFGGFMSNWIQGQEMGRWFKAIVTHDGITSTQTAMTATDQLNAGFTDFLGPLTSAAYKPGDPYYDFNPFMYVDNWATPHFVVHSSLDYRVPVSEGIALFDMLQQKGVPSKFLNFPDESHMIENPWNNLAWYEEIFAFINEYTGANGTSSTEIESIGPEVLVENTHVSQFELFLRYIGRAFDMISTCLWKQSAAGDAELLDDHYQNEGKNEL